MQGLPFLVAIHALFFSMAWCGMSEGSGLIHEVHLNKTQKLLKVPGSGHRRNSSRPSKVLGKRQVIASETLRDNLKVIAYGYLGSLQIGNPPQTISNILFDTGSYNMWVLSDPCATCLSPGYYNPYVSSSFQNSTSASTPSKSAYVDGSSIAGYSAFEQFAVQNTAASQVQFIAALSTVGFSNSMNGIMGLSFPGGTGIQTYWQKLVATNTVASPVFSYYIDTTETGAGIIFGGVDRSRITGPIQWMPLKPGSSGKYITWNTGLSSINGCQVGSSATAIFDTGTSLTFTSIKAAASINLLLGFSSTQSLQGQYLLYYMDCPGGAIPSSLKSISFQFTGGVVLTIPPESAVKLVMDPSGGPVQCVSLFSGLQGLDDSVFLLGNTFLKNFYTIFDSMNMKIGLAPVNRATNVTSSYSVLSMSDYVQNSPAPDASFTPNGQCPSFKSSNAAGRSIRGGLMNVKMLLLTAD